MTDATGIPQDDLPLTDFFPTITEPVVPVDPDLNLPMAPPKTLSIRKTNDIMVIMSDEEPGSDVKG